MSKIKPHANAFTNADCIAECTNGLSELAYMELWNVVVPRMKTMDAENFDSPSEYYSADPLPKYWDLLSEQAQIDINTALEAEEKKWRVKC